MSADEEVRPGEEFDDEVLPVVEVTPPRQLLTDDSQLRFDDAENIAASNGVAVVMLMGEVASGKTSLLVTIWNKLMNEGRVGPVAFAGSRTALGFERRAWLTRLASQSAGFDMVRTYQRDDGFLHLRLERKGAIEDLMLSDLAGETFERVRLGARMTEVIPWAASADKALVLVDGSAFIDPRRRSTALSRARMQLRHLAEDLPPADRRIGVVLTMSDVLRGNSDARARWKHEREELRVIAASVDPVAKVFDTSAKSGSGLGPLIEWLQEPSHSVPLQRIVAKEGTA